MYCTNCGQLLNLTLSHCHNCGLQLNAQPSPDSVFVQATELDAKRSSRWKRGIVQAAVALGVIVFGYVIWKLTYWLLDVGMLHNQKNGGGDILSVVFDISSSTLTLVGLVTIFVSINGQHRIQRCREILWELMELPYQCWNDRGQFVYKFSLEQGIRQRFLSYKEVLGSGRAFNYVIVFFSFVIITVVSSMITATITGLGLDYFNNLNEITFIYHAVSIGVVMMLAFGILILSLARITLIASLPSLEDLIDTDTTKTGVASLLFAAITMRVIPTNPLIVRFAFPFRNLKVYPWIVGTVRDTQEEVLILGGPFESDRQKYPLSKVHIDMKRAHRMRYLVLEEFDVSRYQKLTYKFELQSKQGMVYVQFEQEVTSDGQTEDWLHPIGIGPKLVMENRLFEKLFSKQ